MHFILNLFLIRGLSAIRLNVSGCLVECDECNGTGEVEKNIHRGPEGMQIEMDVMVVCSQCDGTGLSDIQVEEVAFKEFNNVGDKGLFPNHTDKDIWVNGFKAGFKYCFSNSR